MKNIVTQNGTTIKFQSFQQQTRRKSISKKTLNPELFVKDPSKVLKELYVSAREIKDLPVDQDIVSNLLKKGYHTPTEIQDKSIEPILNGNDLIGLAQTGTGKTGAFLVPLIHQLLGQKPAFQLLIITPTRELAVQIDQEFKSIAAGLSLFSECLIGGTEVRKDMIKLRRPCHAIIGTPGRISDMVRQRALRPEHFSTLVLDEFDRLLDMGFLADIFKLVDAMPNRKQTILFSATEDKGQMISINKLLKNPVEVKLKNGNNPGENIEQKTIRVKENENKMDLLLNLLKDPDFEKVLIFADTKRWVGKICKGLKKAGVKADEIHGDKSQTYRISALKAFKNEIVKVLVATDVAARGLDINNVSHVINFQQPQSMDSYIHRIGRTGRAGKTGKAVTFIN